MTEVTANTAPAYHPATRERTLSKSDFTLAATCPAKLYFRENGYTDNRANDPYLEALAAGGYMVEALAKARYPDGIKLDYGRDPAADHAERAPRRRPAALPRGVCREALGSGRAAAAHAPGARRRSGSRHLAGRRTSLWRGADLNRRPWAYESHAVCRS